MLMLFFFLFFQVSPSICFPFRPTVVIEKLNRNLSVSVQLPSISGATRRRRNHFYNLY